MRSCAWLQVHELGSGQFGITMLMKDVALGEVVAVKFLKRGRKVIRVAALASQASTCILLITLLHVLSSTPAPIT